MSPLSIQYILQYELFAKHFYMAPNQSLINKLMSVCITQVTAKQCCKAHYYENLSFKTIYTYTVLHSTAPLFHAETYTSRVRVTAGL